jgi:hypothetical protein
MQTDTNYVRSKKEARFLTSRRCSLNPEMRNVLSGSDIQ